MPYWIYHKQHLERLENPHPGAFVKIESFVSVRRDKSAIGQATDFAAEQTYMQNAKTTDMLVHYNASSPNLA